MPKTPIGQILTQNLAPYLKERGTQARIAERTGLSIGTVSEIARGLVTPQIDTLDQIAGALGLMAWELLLDSEESRRRAWSKIMAKDPNPTDFDPPANQPLPGNVREMKAGKRIAARSRKKKTGQNSPSPGA